MIALLTMLLCLGCSRHDENAGESASADREKARLVVHAEDRLLNGNDGMPTPAAETTAAVSAAIEWRIAKVGRYIDDERSGNDFRAVSTAAEALAVADELEHDILETENHESRIAGIYEYLLLAEEFGDFQYGPCVDDATGRRIRNAESFQSWSNRVTVSYLFLCRALEFARLNDLADETAGSAHRYRQACGELCRFEERGMKEHAAVLSGCVSRLGDELDRDDGVLKKVYDRYRSACASDEDARYMLDFIAKNMGRLPKWAESAESSARRP